MYLNGLYEPLPGVLQLFAKKISSSLYEISKLTLNQMVIMEVCYAD